MQSSVKKGVSFLQKSASSESFFVEILISTNLLDTLNTVKNTSMITNCIQTLETQQSAEGPFNYWWRGSKKYKSEPYPDDLDDTFCALSLLHEISPKHITGDLLARVTRLLTSLEVKEGGPYRTWVVSGESCEYWKDIDLAVNSNIAYFLSLVGIELPSITTLVEESTMKGTLTSPYYVSEFPVIYFISRFYRGSFTPVLINLLLEKKNEGDVRNNPLWLSLVILSLLNLGYQKSSLKREKLLLEGMQKEDGSWSAVPFIVENKREGRLVGSPQLTTSFAISALQKLYSSEKPSNVGIKNLLTNITFETIESLSKVGTNKRVEFLVKSKAKEVTLPYVFCESLGRPITREVKQLMKASLYGWVAYTIYDDFYDEEGSNKELPYANYAFHKLNQIYVDIGKEDMLSKAIFRMEKANSWEIENCRFSSLRVIDTDKIKTPDFGDYRVLSDKSFGHALGALAQYPGSKLLNDFFENYLIARQLNDDAHDWYEDLTSGYINSVGAMLLKRMGGEVRLNHELIEYFWLYVIEDVCNLVTRHLERAKVSLHAFRPMQDKSYFLKMVEGLEGATKQALEEKAKTFEFLDQY